MLFVFVAKNDIADISDKIPLSEYRKRKIDATWHEDIKRGRRAAGVLLSYALKRCFGLDDSTLQYAEEDLGKPFLIGQPNVHFNISHTDGYCAVAVADSHVGVDIQLIDREMSERRLRVAERYFSEAEFELSGLMEDPSLFYRLWTAKESAVKCTGEGLSMGIRRFCFPADIKRGRCGDMFFSALDIDEYAMTVCTFVEEDPIVEHVSASDILGGSV